MNTGPEWRNSNNNKSNRLATDENVIARQSKNSSNIESNRSNTSNRSTVSNRSNRSSHRSDDVSVVSSGAQNAKNAQNVQNVQNVQNAQNTPNTKQLNESNDIHGCTGRSMRDSNNRCTFNHLFELNFEFNKQETTTTTTNSDRNANDSKGNDVDSSDSEDDDKITNLNEFKDEASNRQTLKKDPLESDWPYFELRVWSIDEWKRKTFVGLAILGLPEKAGQYVEQVDVWSLNSSRPKHKLMHYFLGYSLEPKARLTVGG